MAESPLVSIGAPVYKSEKTIRTAVESLMGQDYANLEIIISDNASPDETYNICQELAGQDPRIRLSRNPENMGAVRNFEIVAEKATGKYFFWAAGDDWWHPEFVSALVNALEADPRAAVALPAIEREWEDGTRDVVRFTGPDDPKGQSTCRLLLNILPYKKSVVKKKYNFFLVGLMRTQVLHQFLPTYPFNDFGERPILAAMALNHRFVFVDRVLMKKVQHERQFKDRHPDDPFKKQTGFSGPEKRLAKSFAYVYGSPAAKGLRAKALLGAVAASLGIQVIAAKVRGKAALMLGK